MVMKRKKEKISFWKTFQLYWQVARPYTPLFIFAAFLVTIMSITHVIEKFLFKIIIDNGETYTAGTLDASVFSKILFIV